MGQGERRALLEQLEASPEASAEDLDVALCLLALQEVTFDEYELRAARRRSLLLLAAGGDPTRRLRPDDRAVRSLAADLETRERVDALAAGLRRLTADARGLRRVEARLEVLLGDLRRGWRQAAVALLADELLETD